MLNQGVCRAKADGQGQELDVVHQDLSRLKAVPQLKGHDPAESVFTLPRGQVMMGVRVQPGVLDLGDRGVLLQPSGQVRGAVAVAFHAERKRQDPSLNEPGIEGSQDCPCILHGVSPELCKERLACCNAPATTSPWPDRHLVALCTTISIPIDPPVEGSLEIRGHEGVVHHRGNACTLA